MLRRVGVVFVTAGVVLISSALLLFFYNEREDKKAGQEAGILLENLQEYIKKQETVAVTPEMTQEPENPLEETPKAPADEEVSLEPLVVEIDGYGYIGYLSIPKLGLELPVMSDWDYKRLKIAPCRQFGSPKTDNFVIAAHNYKSHFKYLTKLEAGDLVYFTDMEGQKVAYAVVRIETLKPEAVNAVQKSGCDLVLYTCTPGGASREAVFCNRSIS